MQASFWGLSLLAVISALLGFFFFQGKLIYHPGRTVYSTPCDAGLKYEAITLTTRDGIKIQSWWVPSSGAHYTVLFCHGNAGTLASRVETARIWHELGCNILLFDYRGYGQSKGKPSEKGTYRDAEAAWEWLCHTQQIQPDQIILHGRSLGGPIAAYMAKSHKSAALIVESTFINLKTIAGELYPFLPVGLLLRYRYPTHEYLVQVTSPVLVIHSSEDDFIGFHHGRKLFTAANSPKQFLEIQGNHDAGYLDSEKEYVEGLQCFLDTLQPSGQ